MSTEVAAARNNNLVAESDLNAALKAVGDRLESIHSPELQHLLQDCQQSLQQNIQRVVQPVTDEAFHLYVYQQKQQDDDDDDETKTTDDADLINNNSTNDDVDDDIDPEELLDQEAWQRVQELRNQVRDKAAAVQVVRTAVCNQAVHLAQRQLSTSSKEPEEKDEKKDLDLAARDKLQEMEESLQTMKMALQQTQDGLPDQMSSLQDTIAAIEHSLHKGLSQTEQAIVRRDDNDNNVMDTTEMAPEERLASFLRDD